MMKAREDDCKLAITILEDVASWPDEIARK
jgi:hypothetical protein